MVSTEHIMDVTSPCAVEISQLPGIGMPMVPLLGDQLYSTGLTAMNVDDPTQTFTCGVSICVADRPQFKTFPLDTDITTNDSRDSQVLGIPTSTCCVGVQDRCAETIIEHTDSSFEETDACGVWLVRRLWTVTSQGTCDNLSASRPQLISIKDTSPPVWTFQPPDVLVDFLAPYGPDATGFATAVDGLENTEDFADLISYPIQIWYQDDITHDPNSCEALAVVSRTWTTEDACENRAVYVQSIRSDIQGPAWMHHCLGSPLAFIFTQARIGGQPHIHEVVMHHETCASGSGYSVVAQKCPKLDNVDTGNGMHEVKCPKLRSCRKTDPFDFCDQTNTYGLGASTSQLDRFEFNFTEANAVLVASSHKIETLTMNSVVLRAGPIIVNCTNPSLCQALKYNIISSIFGLVGSDLLYNFFAITALDLLATDESSMLQVRSPSYLEKTTKSRREEERLFKSLALDGSSANFVLFNAPDFAALPKKRSSRDMWGDFSGSLLVTNQEFSPKLKDFMMAGQLLTTGSLDVKDSEFLCGMFAADTTCQA